MAKTAATLRHMRLAAMAALAVAAAALAPQPAAQAEPRHAIAMHGTPKYGPGFSHFDYVNPDAPRGGTLRLAVTGSFDSLNPFIVRGVPARDLRSYVFESLMTRSRDEPFTLYGLIAQSIDVPDDRSRATFTLNPKARFSDGTPVTVDDVVFSLKALREHGQPNLRQYYGKVVRIERPGGRRVTFVFQDGEDRELPLILGLMPILPRHRYDDGRLALTSLEPPVGSGPYVVADVEAGSALTYRRDPDYWGRDLPVNRGRYNFAEIRYSYFRDSATDFEAFKKGLYDIREETDPTRWATGYDFPAVRSGEVVRETFRTGLPAPFYGLVFNTRRALFADVRVREALVGLLDFTWLNATLYHGLYERTESYFPGSELSSFARPASEAERTLLQPFPDAVPDAFLSGRYRLPEGAASGRDRKARKAALSLLAEAGWTVRDGRLTNAETGAPFRFGILTLTHEQERLALTYARMLRRIGIEATIRQADSSQFQSRLDAYDYDMVPNRWYNSLSPGNEQAFYWGSAGRDTPGTRNYMGADEPAIDAMIGAILAARTRGELVTATRALDRVLRAGFYAVPLFHAPAQWVARRKRLAHPDTTPLYGYQLDTWWIGTEDGSR
ncbi:ABC transporter substrate-binding protein [Kaustia mangrovi]|uniref:ABC transporter substrate-binding protein n=1 Tax=Kaustia mangrovi TaxID=2593653 RepID=A0A7S8C129_9HYPH|nr:extracellular solute-binding protein [Kaustia mangrovi]QPC41406.1 ABC transporter substrate-binding protein [Kaustia mangrovi]